MLMTFVIFLDKVTGAHANIIRGGEAHNWLYVESDQSHGTTIKWGQDPAQKVQAKPTFADHQIDCSFG